MLSKIEICTIGLYTTLQERSLTLGVNLAKIVKGSFYCSFEKFILYSKPKIVRHYRLTYVFVNFPTMRKSLKYSISDRFPAQKINCTGTGRRFLDVRLAGKGVEEVHFCFGLRVILTVIISFCIHTFSHDMPLELNGVVSSQEPEFDQNSEVFELSGIRLIGANFHS